jgi:GTP cyclohydrolase IA
MTGNNGFDEASTGIDTDEVPTTPDEMRIADAIADLITAMGGNLEDENLRRTPQRAAKWFVDYSDHKPGTLAEILQPRFTEDHRELVLVRNVQFSALCAHHLLPFRGRCHVGYIPNGQVVGLSKLIRAVHWVANRLTLQERITRMLCDGIDEELKPLGVMVIVEADHACMTMRGVRAFDAETVTSAVRGVFRDPHEHARIEFLTLIRPR